MSQKCVYVRFNSLVGQLVKDYRVDLYDKDGLPLFSAHPNKMTDIVALQILPGTLINDQSIWGAFALKNLAKPGVDFVENPSFDKYFMHEIIVLD